MRVIKRDMKPDTRSERRFQAYLGDSVYVYLDEFGDTVLYTSNGAEERNRIVLEPRLLDALQEWVLLTAAELSSMLAEEAGRENDR